MGADRVAIIVVSSAPKNTPTYIVPRVRISRLVESSLGRTTCSVEDGPVEVAVSPSNGDCSSTSREAAVSVAIVQDDLVDVSEL